jgi:hypothetical protein
VQLARYGKECEIVRLATKHSLCVIAREAINTNTITGIRFLEIVRGASESELVDAVADLCGETQQWGLGLVHRCTNGGVD